MSPLQGDVTMHNPAVFRGQTASNTTCRSRVCCDRSTRDALCAEHDYRAESKYPALQSCRIWPRQELMNGT